MRGEKSHIARWCILTALTTPLLLLLSACPPPVDQALGTAVSDKIAPQITIASPRNGQNYASSVTVTGTITDDALTAGDGKGALKSIDFTLANNQLVQGKILINADGSARQDASFGPGVIAWVPATKTFSFVVSTIFPSRLTGLMIITVHAVDANGNPSSSVLQLSENTNGPVITILHPTGTELTFHGGASFTLEGTVGNSTDDPSSASNIASVSWSKLDQTWGATVNVAVPGGTYSAPDTGIAGTPNFTFNSADTSRTFTTTFNMPFISDDPLTLSVSATDLNGHTKTVLVQLANASNAGPQITILSPNLGATQYYSPAHYAPMTVTMSILPVPLSLTALNFQVAVGGTTSSLVNINNNNGTGDPSYSYDATTGMITFMLKQAGTDTTSLQGKSGTAIVTISAVNTNNKTTNAPITIFMDNTPPAVTNVATANSTTGGAYAKAGETVTLSFNAADALSGFTATGSNPLVTWLGTNPLNNLGGGSFSTTLIVPAGTANDGPVQFSITATDNVGNITTPVTAVTIGTDVIIDNTPPTVALSDNLGSTGWVKTGAAPTITATFADGTGSGINETTPPTITISGTAISGAAMTRVDNLHWTFNSWTVPSGTDGTSYAVSITASDRAGNPSAAATGVTSYTLDNAAPTLGLSDNRGSTGFVKAGAITITATFADGTGGGISETTPPTITISGQGITNAAMTRTDNLHWTYSLWTVPGGPDGTVANVSITASDRAGNPHAAATGMTSYTLDNTPPSLALSDNLGSTGFVKSGVTPTITATFADGTGSGISETTPPTITISGTAFTGAAMTRIDNLHWTFNSWTVPSGTDGSSYAVSITATDRAGNAHAAATGVTSYTIDNTGPNLAISDNLGSTGWVKTGANPTITATFDDFGVSGISETTPPTITISGTAFTGAAMTRTDNLHWTFNSWTVPSGTDGSSYAVSITASDRAGNAHAAATGVTSYTLDNAAPSLALSDNRGNTGFVKAGAITITATFADGTGGGISETTPPTITISGQGITGAAMTRTDNLHWTYSLWTVPSGSDGTVANVSITASDRAGNPHAAATGMTSYTLDNTPPSLALSDNLGSTGFVKSGVTPTITATFADGTGSGISETTPPTITISGTAFTGAAMTRIDNLHWTFNSWTVPSGTDGTSYAVSITASDRAGNAHAAATGVTSYTIDNTGPNLAISDNLGSTGWVKTGANPTITATFDDFGVSGISESTPPTITISGTAFTGAAMTRTDNLHWTFNGWTVPSGTDGSSYAVSITATDRAGNAHAAATGVTSYTLDNAAPSLALSDNRGNTGFVKAGAITITATFADGTGGGISETTPPTITISGQGITGAAMTRTDNLHWTYSLWTVPSGPDGTVANVSITASDRAGNPHAAATGMTSYTLDDTPPTLALSDNLGSTGWVTTGANPTITATFGDGTGSGISETTPPTITISGTIFTGAAMTRIDNLHWTFNSWTVPSGTDGTSYAVSITASDRAGNAHAAATGVTSYTIDNTGPGLAISDNRDSTGVVKAGAITITATFDDGTGGGISESTPPTITISGTAFTGAAMTRTDNLHWTFNSWTVPGGDGASYAVSITATDKAGNAHTAATGVTSYTTDNTPPSITSITMVSAAPPPADSSKYADVLFDTPVYSDTSHSALLAASLTVTDTDASIQAGVSSISNTSGNTWRLTLTWSTTPATGHHISVTAATAASVYDAAGNAMAAGAGSSGGVALSIAGGHSGVTVQQGTSTTMGRLGSFLNTALGRGRQETAAPRVVGAYVPSQTTTQGEPETRPQFALTLPGRSVSTTPDASAAAASPASAGTRESQALMARAPGSTAVAGTSASTALQLPQNPLRASGQPGSQLPPWWMLGLGTLAVGIVSAGAWLGLRMLRQRAGRP